MTNDKGFTLIEIIISIFILTVGIVTVVGLITTNVRAMRVVKNSVLAAQLSQEGIEVIRAIRNTNWIQNLRYDTGLANGTYCVNYNSTSTITCANFNIFFDAARGYTHDPLGQATPFRRQIDIFRTTDAGGVEYLRVRSTVNWDSRSIVTETHLYDWR
jgi:prepilin-type N-terminal cleavage/methylation domain-containing protein